MLNADFTSFAVTTAGNISSNNSALSALGMALARSVGGTVRTALGTIVNGLSANDVRIGWAPRLDAPSAAAYNVSTDLGTKVTFHGREAATLSGTEVTQWTDKSSTGTSITNNGAGTGPNFLTNGGPNGRAFMRTTGSKYLIGPAFSNLISASAFEIYMVVRLNAAPNAQATIYNRAALLADGNATFNAGAYFGLHVNNTRSTQGFVYDGSIKATPATDLALNKWERIRFRLESGTLYMKIGALAEQAIASGNVQSLAFALRIARAAIGSEFLDCDIAELIICNATLSAAERKKVDDYHLDYFGLDTGVTGLVNESETVELALRNGEYDDAAWTKNQVTITANAVAGPDGNTTADALFASNTNSVAHSVTSSAYSVTSGQQYTVSAIVKANQVSFECAYLIVDGTLVIFHLSEMRTNGVLPGSGIDSGIEDYGNGWYRIWVTYQAASTTTHTFNIGSCQNLTTNIAVASTGTALMYIYRSSARLVRYNREVVETAGATVTQTGDVLTCTSDANVVDGGRIKAEFEFVAKTLYNDPVCTDPVLLQVEGSDSYVYFLNGVLNFAINGFGTVAAASALKFRTNDRVRVYVEFGNGGTKAYGQINGGALIQLVNDATSYSAITTTGGAVVFGSYKAAGSYRTQQNKLPCHWLKIRCYAAADAAPSWTAGGKAKKTADFFTWPFSNRETNNDASNRMTYTDLVFTRTLASQRMMVPKGPNAQTWVPNTGNCPAIGGPSTATSNRGLMLQVARTNAIVNSSILTTANGWTAGTGVTLASNTSVLGPDGTTNGLTSIVYDGSGAAGAFRLQRTQSFVSGDVLSIWLRCSSGTGTVSLRFGTDAPETVVCNLTTTWQRFTIPLTATGTSVQILAASGDNSTFTVYAWGLQGETGAYATDLINNAGGTFARPAPTIAAGDESEWRDNGKFSLEYSFVAIAPTSQQAVNLFLRGGDTARQDSVSLSTAGALTFIDLITNTSTITSTNTISWATGDLVQVWLVYGKGTVTAKARVTTAAGVVGSITTFTFPAYNNIPSLAGATQINFCSNNKPGYLRNLTAYYDGELPPWLANITLNPSGVASGFAAGGNLISAKFSGSGIATGFASGTEAVTRKFSPSGIASSFVSGLHTSIVNTLLNPAGIASGFAAGSEAISRTLAATGIATAFAAGVAAEQLKISTSGIATGFASGTAKVSTVFAVPAGVASAFAAGSHKELLKIYPSGIASAQALGLPVAIYPRTFTLSGIASAESMGQSQTIVRVLKPAGIQSALAFGPNTTVENPAGWVIVHEDGSRTGEGLALALYDSHLLFQALGFGVMPGIMPSLTPPDSWAGEPIDWSTYALATQVKLKREWARQANAYARVLASPSRGGGLGQGFKWRGQWDPNTPYYRNDVVGRNGSSWVALNDNVSQDPEANTRHWDLVALKGDTGSCCCPVLANTYAQPSVGQSVTVELAGDVVCFDCPAIGQMVFVAGGGYYRVTARPSSILVTIELVEAVTPGPGTLTAGAAACNAGEKGAQGIQGVNAYTCATAAVQLYSVGSNVEMTFAVGNSSWMLIGQYVFAVDATYGLLGIFVVTAKPDTTHVSVKSVWLRAGAPVGQNVQPCFSPSGRPIDSTTRTRNSFVQPGVGSTVTVDVGSSAGLIPNTFIDVFGGGTYEIAGIISETQVSLKNTGADGNATIGATIATDAQISLASAGSPNTSKTDFRVVFTKRIIHGTIDGSDRVTEGWWADNFGIVASNSNQTAKVVFTLLQSALLANTTYIVEILIGGRKAGPKSFAGALRQTIRTDGSTVPSLIGSLKVDSALEVDGTTLTGANFTRALNGNNIEFKFTDDGTTWSVSGTATIKVIPP